MCIWLLPLHLHSHSGTYGLKSAPLLHAPRKGTGLENLPFLIILFILVKIWGLGKSFAPFASLE